MIHRKLHTARRGFTLIELLVSAALSVLIMAVISLAFQQATATMSQLKSVSDLASRLRIAENLLRQDLEAAHFDGPDVNSLADSPARMKVSDLRYDKITGDPLFAGKVRAPVGGYFRLEHNDTMIVEGRDQDGLSSTSALRHVLRMTVIRTGNSAAEEFTNAAGIHSRHAEVIWKLSDGPTSNANAVPTFTLLRYVHVLQDPRIPASMGPTGLPRSLQSVTPVAGRFPIAGTNGLPLPTPPPPLLTDTNAQDAIVITNVVSFEVKPTWEGGALPRPALGAMVNSDYPFDVLSPNPGDFFESSTVPTSNSRRINAVKVKIRLYDPKTKLTRQSSFIVKL